MEVFLEYKFVHVYLKDFCCSLGMQNKMKIEGCSYVFRIIHIHGVYLMYKRLKVVTV
jgi:hypothetical protein